MNTEKLSIKRAHCSYYENVKSKRNQVITLAQFVTAIRSGRWKKAVEDFRRLKAEGRLRKPKASREVSPELSPPGCAREGTPNKMSFSSACS